MLYSAKVMEHFANPHNVGEIPDANGVGEVGNQKCGDIMKIFLKIENGIIAAQQSPPLPWPPTSSRASLWRTL